MKLNELKPAVGSTTAPRRLGNAEIAYVLRAILGLALIIHFHTMYYTKSETFYGRNSTPSFVGL